MLERTSLNVKDKFKQLVGKDYENKTNDLTLIECLKILKYIQDSLYPGESQVKLFKYVYKFKENVEKNNNRLFILLDQEGKIKLDESIKKERNKLIIKNILKIIIDIEKLKEIVFNDNEIPWKDISEKIKIPSEDCQNKWLTILNMFNLSKRYQISKDLKMLTK